MEYSNPKIPEEINYSKENNIKEFLYLLIGIFFVIAVFVVSVHFFAQNFAHHIPFEYEKKIMPSSFDFEIGEKETTKDQGIQIEKKQTYLSNLANNLATHMSLPEGMQIHVNYVNTDTINAGATLNGQIFIYQGLLDYVESENELAMVIAHEIAHIKARHPIKALSSGMIIGITMAIIGGSIDNGGAASILTSGTTLTSLNFSRKQESEADELALQALYTNYGHTLGSDAFFKRLGEDNKSEDYLAFLSTHPASGKRIEKIQLLSQQHYGNPGDNISLTELPSYIKTD